MRAFCVLCAVCVCFVYALLFSYLLSPLSLCPFVLGRRQVALFDRCGARLASPGLPGLGHRGHGFGSIGPLDTGPRCQPAARVRGTWAVGCDDGCGLSLWRDRKGLELWRDEKRAMNRVTKTDPCRPLAPSSVCLCGGCRYTVNLLWACLVLVQLWPPIGVLWHLHATSPLTQQEAKPILPLHHTVRT